MNERNTVKRIYEPGLEFRYGQVLTDPRDGLSLFGPQDTDLPSHPRSITYGVIGTDKGIAAFSSFSSALSRPQYVIPEPANRRLWPTYPGFEATFHCVWPEAAAIHEINQEKLSESARNRDPNKRAYDVVNAYLEGIKRLSKRDEAFDIFICIVPDEIWLNCRPQSRVTDGLGESVSARERKLRIAGERSIFNEYAPEQYRLSTDFRRQIKARAMEYGVPIQIVRESTLELDQGGYTSRGLTPFPDRAWNLSTTLYYKAGGKPWRLSTAREGVCYVGLAFRKSDPNLSSKTAVCAAQMFIDTGDGIVFLGEYGPWYSPERLQFHLTKQAAKGLLSGVLETYEQLDGRPLKEIFLHSRSEINQEEFKGYIAACPSDAKLVGIRVRVERAGLRFRLFREGRRPMLRGTFLKLNHKTGYLWATGFKPELGTYDGWEVPAPLRIDVQHGEADINQVASDILSLTKLNYNACKLGSSQPVTVGFSDAVGEILVSNPDVKYRRPQFKFYI